jgi:hypothetical protein
MTPEGLAPFVGRFLVFDINLGYGEYDTYWGILERVEDGYAYFEDDWGVAVRAMLNVTLPA